MKRSKIFKFLFYVIGFIALERFCYSQTAGFRLSKASTSHVYPFSSTSEQPPALLNQPFYYLGKGVQFYAFVGEDQQTILKLFKHHHAGFSTDSLKVLLPDQIAAPILQRRERRMIHLFKSTEIAHKRLPQETAVLYTHLNKSDHLLGKIEIYDKLGIRHKLDLDQTEFVIQKRVIPFEEKLHSLFNTNQTAKALCAMQDLVTVIETRSKKGVKNKDGWIIRNCGFLEDVPIELDIGSFVMSKHSENPNTHRKAKLKATLKLLKWVETNYPDHLQLAKDELLSENPN